MSSQDGLHPVLLIDKARSMLSYLTNIPRRQGKAYPQPFRPRIHLTPLLGKKMVGRALWSMRESIQNLFPGAIVCPPTPGRLS
jgi:hypothetical protein